MLIVAEKYRMAQIIAKVLGFNKFRFPFFFNEAGDAVVYSQGHLFEAVHGQDDVYTWSDPSPYENLPKTFRFEPLPDYEIQVKGKSLSTAYLREHVPEMMRQHDVIVNACDPDREGERIFYDLFNAAACEAMVLRLDLSRGITHSLITHAFENLYPAYLTKNKSYSAQARCISDFAYALLTVVTTYYGRKGVINPIFANSTCKTKSVLAVGRVIIPALDMINKRCIDVESNKYRTVYCPEIIAQHGNSECEFSYDFKRIDAPIQPIATDLLATAYVKRKTLSDKLVIDDISHRVEFVSPPAMYDTPSMQADSPFDPKETMSILQSLYEKGLITYPRTDDSDVPDDDLTSDKLKGAFDSIKQNLGTVTDRVSKGQSHFLGKLERMSEKASPSKSSPDSSLNVAHTALCPTNAQADLSRLNDNELMVYTKICQRFTDALGGERAVTVVSITGRLASDIALGHGMLGELEASYTLTRTLRTGDVSKSSDDILSLSEGDEMPILRISVAAVDLDVPKYYKPNEIPLAMRNIGESVDDPKIKAILEQAKGLGSAGTRDEVIPSLLKRDYIELSRFGDDELPSIVITSKGQALLAMLPDIFKNPETTAKWESVFSRIEQTQNLDEARSLRDEFIKQTFSVIETYVKKLNACYRNDNGVRSSSLTQTKQGKPSRALKDSVVARAKALSVPVPSSVLNCAGSCEKWLNSNPLKLHSKDIAQLERSGLAVDRGTVNDERSINMRRESLSGGNSNPPTPKRLNETLALAKKVGKRVPKDVYNYASDCEEFHAQCLSKLLPTKEQAQALREVAAQLNVQVSKETFNSRKETLALTHKLKQRRAN